MTTILFYSCLIAILLAGILQSPRIQLHSLYRRWIGSLIFLFPITIWLLSGVSAQQVGLLFLLEQKTFIISAALSIAIAVLNFFTAGTLGNLEVYPQIRKPIWNLPLLFHSTLAWMVYLLVYEIVFRGILLYSSLSIMPMHWAVLLNTVVYSLAHLIKNKREAILSIPFGLMMIYLTLNSQSCWYAVVIHIVLAISHEWSSIRAQPNMSVRFSFQNIKE